MGVRPIRTEVDYDAAVEEIERLMDAAPGTAERDKLEVLAILVEAYEAEHHPVPLPDPISAIEFHMGRLGLVRKDLVPYIGSRGRVSEILRRRRPLTLRMIRSLEEGLGIPAAILVQAYDLVGDDPPGAESGQALATTERETEPVVVVRDEPADPYDPELTEH